MCIRDELAEHLIQEATRLQPQGVSFTFNANMTSVNLEERLVRVQANGTEEARLLPACLLPYGSVNSRAHACCARRQ